MPQVTMPDGTVVNMPDTVDPALGARLRAYHAAHAPKLENSIPSGIPGEAGKRYNPDGSEFVQPEQAAPTPQPARFADKLAELGNEYSLAPITDPLIGGAEAGLAGVTDLFGKILGGAAGAGQMMLDPTADPARQGGPADTARGIHDFFAYQPGERGRDLLAPVAAGAEHVMGNLPQDDISQTVTPAFFDLAASLAPVPKGVSGAVRAGEAAVPGAVESVSPAVEALRAGGIKFRPSDVRAITPDRSVKVPGEFREKFAKGPELKSDLTLDNQATLTKRAADKIGTKDLSDKSLDAAEAPHIAKYQMAEQVAAGVEATPEFQAAYDAALASAQLPKGEAHGVTRVIGALRRRANKRTASGDVKTEEAGYADRDLADSLEEQFGKQLERAGESQLLGEYQQARQSLAQINDVRGATRAEQIDAAALRRLNERYGGNRLTGDLKFIADASEFAPNVTGHSTKTAMRAGDEVPSSREGFITRGAKALVRKIPGMDVGAEGFQESLGPVNPARSSYYGTAPDVAPAPQPQQRAFDLRQVLGLEAPPGTVGTPPSSVPRGPTGPQVDALGSEFEFAAPPGAVGIPDPAQIELQQALGVGEPLFMKAPPGRVGKPKRKP